MAVWDELITSRDRRVYAEAGYGGRSGLGRHPGLLVVDVNYDFVGEGPLPILESIETWHNSCGEAGWGGVAAIAELLAVVRAIGAPVFYSTGFGPDAPGLTDEQSSVKDRRSGERPVDATVRGDAIPSEIAPATGEVVIRKRAPSAFFQTSLAAQLHRRGVDTLLVTGATTSGCVRASVVDAFSYGFRVAVVEEGTFDRGEVTHVINLFDMDQKYADVISLADAISYVRGPLIH